MRRPIVVDGDVAIIQLTKGYFTGVDAADAEKLDICNWSAIVTQDGHIYASGKRDGRCILMHREILGVKDRRILVDHINRNTLDNRRENLRRATTSQNAGNSIGHRDSMSGVKGVQWHRKGGKWMATIGVRNKVHYLGIFSDKGDAAEAYRRASEFHFGEFSRVA